MKEIHNWSFPFSVDERGSDFSATSRADDSAQGIIDGIGIRQTVKQPLVTHPSVRAIFSEN